jgi:hypothetical protein
MGRGSSQVNAKSLDVLIPTRRVARLLRGTRLRTYAHRHLAVVGVCRTGIRSPGTEDPRCYLVKQLHGRAEDVDTKRIPADPIRIRLSHNAVETRVFEKELGHGCRPRWRQRQLSTNITGGSLNEAGQCCGEHRYWRSLS